MQPPRATPGTILPMQSIRVTLDGVRHTLQAMLSNGDAWREAMGAEIDKALSGFDWEREVTEAARKVVQEQVRFAVERAVRDVFNEEAVRGAVERAAREAAAREVRRMLGEQGQE